LNVIVYAISVFVALMAAEFGVGTLPRARRSEAEA
jgi:hypothetical protein